MNANLWKLADMQAKQIKLLKSKLAKSQQIVMLCKTLVRAMSITSSAQEANHG